ncbi:MAG: toprim domain-containing protein [Methylacidiphilaceae bacterium]|nr:toprim domain-containing protein [Candidatus Methylacidiphilaceae bacterium]
MSEEIEEFGAFLRDRGFEFDGPPLMDGRYHRVPIVGDKGGAKSGAYCGFLDGVPNGLAKNWRTGEEWRWISQVPRRRLTEEERRQWAAANETKKRAKAQELAAAQRAAAKKAAAIFHYADPTAADGHPYLVRKGVRNHGLRKSTVGDLLMPLRNADDKIESLQIIRENGSKQFWRAGRIEGNSFRIGDWFFPGVILVAEGYATGASLHEATGLPVAVAGSSANLRACAEALRAQHPGAELYVAADNDFRRERNVGLEKATAAAAIASGRTLVPRPEWLGESGTDWNDVHHEHGLEQMRELLANAGLPLALRAEQVISTPKMKL